MRKNIGFLFVLWGIDLKHVHSDLPSIKIYQNSKKFKLESINFTKLLFSYISLYIDFLYLKLTSWGEVFHPTQFGPCCLVPTLPILCTYPTN